jgi:hypothetical protein
VTESELKEAIIHLAFYAGCRAQCRRSWSRKTSSATERGRTAFLTISSSAVGARTTPREPGQRSGTGSRHDR